MPGIVRNKREKMYASFIYLIIPPLSSQMETGITGIKSEKPDKTSTTFTYILQLDLW